MKKAKIKFIFEYYETEIIFEYKEKEEIKRFILNLYENLFNLIDIKIENI